MNMLGRLQRLRPLSQAARAGRLIAQDAPGGVLTTGTCPACGVEIQAGVKSPEPATKKRKKAVKQAAIIIQVDVAKRAMTAVVQAPDTPHLVALPGEDGGQDLVSIVYPPDVVQQACWDFLRDGLQNAVGIDHEEVTDAGIVTPQGEIGTVVENFVAPVCYERNARHITQGSWVQTIQFNDEEVWESVLRGERNAPSLTAPLSQVEFEPIEE